MKCLLVRRCTLFFKPSDSSSLVCASENRLLAKIRTSQTFLWSIFTHKKYEIHDLVGAIKPEVFRLFDFKKSLKKKLAFKPLRILGRE